MRRQPKQPRSRNKFAVVLWTAVLVSALAVVTVRHQNRQAFIAWRQIESAKINLQAERGRLLLEKATWAARRNIVRDARGRLAMRPPAPDEIVLVHLDRLRK